MRQLYFTIAILLLVDCFCPKLQAQNKLYMHPKEGTTISFPLNEIRKLTFPSRTITVYENTGSTHAFSFIELRQARFTEFLSGNNSQDIAATNDLALFPNPVDNELFLRMTVSFVASVEIRISDVHGKTLIIRREHLMPGNNQILLQVSDLPNGLYICRVTNGRNIETTKFLKN